MKFLVLLFVISTQSFLASISEAGDANLSRDEEVAVAAYLQVLRGCCLADGAITMTSSKHDSSAPVWIAPYFGDHVALALLAANDSKKNAGDVALVGKWIEWRVARQERDGFWFDQTGTVSSYRSNGKVDAHDCSAAMFLLVLERFQRSGGNISISMRASAKACLQCIQEVSDGDGLTWAKPTHKVKYLMDCIEVHAGLRAGEAFFRRTKDEEAEACKVQADKIRTLLPKYFGAKEPGLFAWALHPSGIYEGGFEKLYPHGLAQLFGVSFVTQDASVFTRVEANFQPETGPAATGAERFLIAASRLGGNTEMKWRTSVLRDKSLLQRETYSYRPALAVLALCEGTAWMAPKANRSLR